MVSNAFDKSKNTARVASVEFLSLSFILICISGAVTLGEQCCGFDESHTDICITCRNE